MFNFDIINPIIEFVFEGQIIEYKNKTFILKKGYKDGDTVIVYYNPQTKRINDEIHEENTKLLGMIMIGLGVIMILFAVL